MSEKSPTGTVCVPSLRRWGAVEAVRRQVAANTSGRLSAIRISFSRPGGPGNDPFATAAALVDAAGFIAGAPIRKHHVTRWDGGAFILLEFANEVTAEIEMNFALPASMPGIYFVRAFCSGGLITNQPIAGYFNQGGVLLADDASCRTLLVDRDVCGDEIEQAYRRAAHDQPPPVPPAVIELLQEYFQ